VPRRGYVYLLANRPYGTLYTGVTSRLYGRMEQHRSGAVDGFARRYGCKRLVYFEAYDDIRDAIAREHQLKNWRRAWKIELIRRSNPKWTDLSALLPDLPGPLDSFGGVTDGRMR
jgi:putative endonuclease